MERYYQRRVDCRKNNSCSCPNVNPGCKEPSCGCRPGGPKPPSGCQRPSDGNRPDMNSRPSCPCQPVNRAGFNVCRPGDCPPAANADIAMGYVPWQQWECTYPLGKGLFIGTVFPSLDKPFLIGRCAIRP